MSLMMVNVVPRTNRENRKVQMGSAILYSGCKKKIIQFISIIFKIKSGILSWQ